MKGIDCSPKAPAVAFFDEMMMMAFSQKERTTMIIGISRVFFNGTICTLRSHRHTKMSQKLRPNAIQYAQKLRPNAIRCV